ncbi:MAG: hypothetical protein ACI8RA_002852 [Chlamydiales bacterium]|jgi:hypothetical protein
MIIFEDSYLFVKLVLRGAFARKSALKFSEKKWTL